MKKISKFLALLLVVSMILPGIAQASPVETEEATKRLVGKSRIETAIAASKEVYKDGASKISLVL